MLTATAILLIFATILDTTNSQLLCPGNAFPFDYQTCDPELRSQCPSGFTCRPSVNNSTGTTVNLCCESGRMTASDWFTDKQLTPNILPIAPYVLIETVQLSPASAILNFPPARVGDELVVISSPNYITGILQSFTVSNLINPGYIHVVTVIDPLYKPFAVLLNYNIIVGQPTQTVNVTASQRFVAYLDNTVTMPKQDSYRSMYMVLIFYTASPITLEGTTPQDMLLGTCTDTKCLFSSSPLITKLGKQPSAGTLFYLTTKNTVFATDSNVSSSATSSSSFILLTLTILPVFCLIFSR